MTEHLADAVLDDTFQLIAEGVTDVIGFDVCAISVLDDAGMLRSVAVAGNEEARQEMLGHQTPVADIEAEIANAEHWGMLRFVPAERMGLDVEDMGWVPDIAVPEDPNAWHPLDLLLAPLYDADGVLRGLMSMDLPADGMRPQAETRERLQKYAAQAGRAVLTAHERNRLQQQVQLAETARGVVRAASMDLDVPKIIEHSHEALIRGFNALGLWIQTFGAGELGHGVVLSTEGKEIELPDEMVDISEESARTLWELQQVVVLTRDDRGTAALTEEEHRSIAEFLGSIGVYSILFTPLGAGRECLGNLVLTREVDDPPWTDAECRAALDIGHDLGRVLSNARNFARERRLNHELRRLDAYKSQLINTIAHELKNPLTSIMGHLEMLEGEPDVSERFKMSFTAMARGGNRMSRLVEDLLTLSRLNDPGVELVTRTVDLREVVDEVIEMVGATARQHGIDLQFDRPDEPVCTEGDPTELDRVVTNLVSNAVKYTPEGRGVTISLDREDGHLRLRVADKGLGISEADQQHLFEEFFRSTNPAAVARPGTGLGLAIVRRIVARHGGEISVRSALGEGSTFTVRLPASR